MSDKHEMTAKDKQEITTRGEQTKPGPVFTPAVDIFETDAALTILADLPGVTPENLDIDLHDDTLSIIGDIAPQKAAGETLLMSEYQTGRYMRRFTLPEVIDQPAIKADLVNGVLRLTLPKIEKAKPRKISVSVG